MKLLEALSGFFGSLFSEGERASRESEQEGAEGRAYDAELKRQYDAYYKAHGTADGFRYQEPSE